MSIASRRRALMGAGGIVLPPIPEGYITNGLVFFLDGKQLATASKWTDIVGGKTFSLTGCTVGTNGGIVFGGPDVLSRGEHRGAVTNDWVNETIEVVFDGITNLVNKTIFNQPLINGNVGIGLRFGDNGLNQVRFATGQDAVRRKWFVSTVPQSLNRLSLSASYTDSGSAVLNGSRITTNGEAQYGANETGITVLGGRKTTNESEIFNCYIGTIYAVRIYNRKLSVAEMQANQATDLTYYNLS